MLTGEILRRAAARVPDKTAVIGADRRLTYGALDRRANRFAHALLAAKLGEGRNAAILSRNAPDYATVHFGAARTGRMLAHISTRYAADELAYVLENADVELVVHEAAFAPILEEVAGRLPGLRRRIAFGPAFEAFLDGQPETEPDVSIADTDAFGMTYTGGTTGFPKGILVSHRARAATAHSVMVEYGFDDRDTIAVVTPLFHVAALNVLYQPAVLAGATCVFLSQWDPESFVEAVARDRVSVAFLVPAQVNQLLRWPGFRAAKPKLASWRKLSFAGAPMPDSVQRELMAELPDLALAQNYGQSELGVLTSLPARYLPEKMGSVGLPILDVEIDVVDLDGRSLGPGEVGEVVARGPNAMIGYYKKPEETRTFFRRGDGWGWTGDVGYRDANGFLFLVDRSKDMIISGGENVYPKEIENVLYELDAVAECAVFGIPDERWGETPKAYVVLKPGRALGEAEAIEHCAARLARFKRPRAVTFVTDLPRTAVGKIQKNALREPYWRGRARKI